MAIEPGPQDLVPQPGPQTEFLSTDADIAVFGGAAGGGKGNPIDTPIVTPYGPRAMGDLAVGDRICSPTHGNTDVIATYELGIREIYRVSFADKTSLDVTGDHLWLVWYARKGRDKKGLKYRLMTTMQVRQYIENGYYDLLVPLPSPIQYTKAYHGDPRPVEPYVLGVLLGDGSLTGGEGVFHSTDEHVADRVSEEYELRARKARIPSWRIKGAEEGLRALELMGKGSGEKFIPEPYSYAPIEERWALAQGLFDADGYVDERGHVEYVSISRRLVEDVATLCRSLGYRVTMSDPQKARYKKDGQYVQCQDKHRLYIQGLGKDRLFSLERKKKRAEIDPRLPEVGKKVVSVEEVGKKRARCIRVDNPNGLYVAGKDLIVTHNTWALLVEPLRHLGNKNFGAVIFRQTYKQIKEKGGMWDQSRRIYSRLQDYGPKSYTQTCDWYFNTGATIDFSYMRYDKHVEGYQGSEIPLIGWDQLEQFSEYQFFYMLSRNRSTSGIRPYVRATCNPDSGSWLAKFLSWWWDEETGYAIEERSGKIRYFYRTPNETIDWANTKRELIDRNQGQLQWMAKKTGHPEEMFIKSFTFIKSDIYDNQILLQRDPQYLANLMALPKIERERLLKGNWLIRAEAGDLFNRAWFTIIDRDRVPRGGEIIRFWDFAATAKKMRGSDPAYTAGVRMKRVGDKYYVTDLYAKQVGPVEADKDFEAISYQDAALAEAEGVSYSVRWEEEGGASGKRESSRLVRQLQGLDAEGVRPSGDKVQRAKPFAAQAEHGEVYVVEAPWTEEYLNHMHHQPEWKHHDIMDASSGAFNALNEPKRKAGTWGTRRR